ncbi:serine hydroxymethyltransferase [Haloarculaceae archaeon H-GB2-1]|nr:serine hydroxymethyltransferase [Haloarculaceae archaeon H-GB1-1]MEA5385745.1 serine hydroxymethyltransferase [Haloarculaceae archaeon H-GB11]MEA5407249.1 serine hydroxymethyltransferase [Haloarculaceae archaeon H-GB2-1]
MTFEDSLEEVDPTVAEAIDNERERQESTLDMIASENHVSKAVLEAQGSAMTNKYAEGYPGERYYGGCKYMDEVENLAIDRAKELFGAEHVNVQPHSGTQANMGVYFSVLDHGDKILSLSLSHGGHLSHGHKVNFSGKFYEVEQYEVDPETGRVDYDEIAAHAEEFDPDMVVSGASAYPREFDYARLTEIADSVDAYHMADIAHITGLVAGGVHRNPIDDGADFVTGSTHKTIRAGRGGMIMCKEEYADAVDSAVFPGAQGGPLMHNVAGKAVGFGEALTDEFQDHAQQIVDNAKVLADVFSENGLSLVSGGTDKHLMLVDLRESHDDLTGLDAEEALEDVGVIVNKNTVPGETRSPQVTSGIRVGTPGITTRGFEEEQIETIGQLIVDVLNNPADEELKSEAAEEVQRLCDDFPIYA